MSQIKIWISKYALSVGIEEVEAEFDDAYPNMVRIPSDKIGYYTRYFHGTDWHRTREGAVQRAENMRIRKLNSLNKQLKKLKEIKFDEVQ